jgi:fatty acid-binding protein DegV
MVPRTHLFAVVKDLKYGVRGGRAPKAALPLQRWLGLIPLLGSKANGRLGIRGALFGRDNLPERFAAALARRLDLSKPWRVLVCHCDCVEDGEALRRALRARIPRIEVDWLIETGSGIGAHAGPGSLVVGVQEAVPLPPAAP